MKFFYRFLLLLLFITGFIYSQQDSVKTTLQEVVITATKTETPYYAVGSSISVITAEMIKQNQLKTVIDILRSVPGLSITQQGGPGKITYSYIRGSNSNHTLVFVDGVKMNDASSPKNAFDFSSLNTNDIDRIEIVRGPQSTLYGSDAIAGVVNIISKNGNSNSPSFSVEGETGSNNYYRSNIATNGSLGAMSYSINASQSGSDGISSADSRFGNTEKDGFSNTSFSANLSYSFSPLLKAGFLYKFTKVKSDLDQFLNFRDDPNYTYRMESNIWKLSLSNISLNGMLDQTLSAAYTKSFNQNLDLTDDKHPLTSADAFNNANRFKIDLQNNFRFIENNLITLGIEREVESANTSYTSTSEWGPFNSMFPNQTISNTGIFLQDQVNFSNSIFISIGVRYDINEKFGNVSTFKIAPCYYIKETGSKFKFSYGTGFKAPSLFGLFDPAYGNPDLLPEKSEGWDLGVEQFFNGNNFSLGITYFGMKLKDMFGYDANFKTINIDKAATSGIEIFCTSHIGKDLLLNANYTYTKTQNMSENSVDFDKPLWRIPEHQLFINANYQFTDRLRLNMSLRYVGKRDDTDFEVYPAERVTLPDYLLMDLSTNVLLIKNLSLTARIENLLDKQYEEVLYYGTLGRCIYVGMNFNL